MLYRITVRSVFAEGESNDSNPVIASLNKNLSRDSSLLMSPQSSFPPSPEKSVVNMRIKEVDDKVEHKADDGAEQNSEEVSTENVVDDLVKENSSVKEDTYSTHTISSSGSSSVDLNDPANTVNKLQNTFTIVQGSNHKECAGHTSPDNTVLQGSSGNGTQGNLEGNTHNETSRDTTTTQGVDDATRENPLDVPSDYLLQLHSPCNSLQSLHGTLTTSSDDSPVATPTSSHSPKRSHQSVEQRRSFFPPIMDFYEDKSTGKPSEDETTTTSSKELANQLLSALEKELSNPLLKPTTCT